MFESDPRDSGPLLDRAWAQREEVAYPAIFGDLGAGIYPLDATLFADAFGQADIDPRWLHYGVFRSAPSAARGHWSFVTSGLSNPWDADTPEEFSGLGHEFVLEATTGSDWLLHRMQHVLAFQILLAHGRYIGQDLLGPYDRLPLHGSIDLEGRSALVHLLVCPPTDPSRSISLVSGKVELYSLVGISEAEAQYARDEGGDRLEGLLRRGYAYPVMDAERRSLF